MTTEDMQNKIHLNYSIIREYALQNYISPCSPTSQRQWAVTGAT